VSNAVTIVPALDEPAGAPSAGPVASEATAVETGTVAVETGTVEPAEVAEEIPGAGRPRRRRAASRPAGPPV
jgi:ribonuclease E